jgi:hypothetical protein
MLQRLENTRAEHHELVVQTLLRIRNLPKEEMQALAHKLEDADANSMLELEARTRVTLQVALMYALHTDTVGIEEGTDERTRSSTKPERRNSSRDAKSQSATPPYRRRRETSSRRSSSRVCCASTWSTATWFPTRRSRRR